MQPHPKKQTLIILITGASGSGKTTVTKAMEKELSTGISVNYFDDVGVPDIGKMIEEYGSREEWQEWATHTWIEKLAKLKSQKFRVLEGSFNPEFAVSKLKELGHSNYRLICLDTSRNQREKRLREERLQPELVTQDMENFAQVLRTKTIELGGTILDTAHLSVQEVTQEILKLAGEQYGSFSL